MQGTIAPAGHLILEKLEGSPTTSTSWKELMYWIWPWPSLPAEVRMWRQANLPQMLKQITQLKMAQSASRLAGCLHAHGRLYLTKIDGRTGVRTPYGLASVRAVTTVFVNDVVDEMDEATDDASLKAYNFHGIGTGTTGADASDTDIETELTTEYNPNSTRATGAQSQPSANIYQTVATNTLDSGTPAITEHGVLTSATVGAGTLCDRHTFAAINLDGTAGDALQSTYQLTFTAGG